jgi:phosphoribosylformylglycinamidine cyclo-ligase
MAKKGLTYKDAGVDIAAADQFVGGIQTLMRHTYGPRIIELKNGFAGLCALGPVGMLTRKYTEPVLAACTDGVGTKLKIAFMMDKHDTVGIDLVAMSVNDLVTVGAEPLLFLDYLATSSIDSDRLTQIVKGVSDGCCQANCALLGGETAEMPGFYQPGEYDLAGFSTGVVDRKRIIDGSRIGPGDVLIGIASSGIHSNGYSLARKVFFDAAKMKITDPVAEFGRTVGEELLEPTRIYAAPLVSLLRHYRVKQPIHGVAHITGGGLPDNLKRILPEKCTARIKKGSWEIPPVFKMMQKLGNVDKDEMYHVFNMGIGMILIVNPVNADAIVRRLKREGQTATILGEIRRGKRNVVIR